MVVTRAVYGSTRALLRPVLARFGVATTFVDATDPDAVEAAITARTRVLYLETISNPTLVVADLAELAERAHRPRPDGRRRQHLRLALPLPAARAGADLVIESCTKWLGGHSDVLAGVGQRAARNWSSASAAGQVDIGGTVAPFSAFLVLRGHRDAGRAPGPPLRDARWPWPVPGGEPRTAAPSSTRAWPAIPRLRSRSASCAPAGACSPSSSGRARRPRPSSMRCACRSAPRRWGASSRWPSIHPRRTHRQLDAAELREAGIAEGLVRISVGLEDVDDLQADLTAGLAAASAGRRPGLTARGSASSPASTLAPAPRLHLRRSLHARRGGRLGDADRRPLRRAADHPRRPSPA